MRFVTDVTKLAEGAIGVLQVVFTGLFPLLVEFAIPIAIFLGIGIVLVELRVIIINYAPTLSSHATKWAHAFNTIGETTGVIIDGILAIITYWHDTISIFTGQLPQLPDFYWPKKVTTFQVEELAEHL